MFLVVYDDGCSLCIPMGEDPSCDGAICVAAKEVALFPSRSAAKQAIKISRLHAQLLDAQGDPNANSDFLNGNWKLIRILKVKTLQENFQ